MSAASVPLISGSGGARRAGPPTASPHRRTPPPTPKRTQTPKGWVGGETTPPELLFGASFSVLILNQFLQVTKQIIATKSQNSRHKTKKYDIM